MCTLWSRLTVLIQIFLTFKVDLNIKVRTMVLDYIGHRGMNIAIRKEKVIKYDLCLQCLKGNKVLITIIPYALMTLNSSTETSVLFLKKNYFLMWWYMPFIILTRPIYL
ncbi:hypothetical protein HanPSC8_Chr11g0450111 [Helianthus annuus]|nr:hypothetical protein HanPSC8_Chr11g0450111 [Helianthus annuus]